MDLTSEQMPLSSPVPSSPDANRSVSDSEGTDPEPDEDEVERLGEDSAELSELSDNIEQEDFAGRPKGKGLSGWIQVIKPLVQGRVMLTLTVVNFILFILTLILLIYLLVFTALISTSSEKRKELQGKINTVDYCSVSWHPLSACSAKCKGVGDRVEDYPTRTSYVDDVTGKCPEYFNKAPEDLKQIKYSVPCNVWACE
ncbi:hypothetical protein niasHS_012416 [Heterodera schachtii]|uniref:Uncharacterized protein n=1 Tax=Heterodera schachtii TaxID=97005 RepID=A0ABD2IMB7_HETSC